MLKKTWLILLAVISAASYGDDSFVRDIPDLFSPVSTDVSLNYLRMLFGTVGSALVAGSTPASNIIAGLFNIFNTGIMVFAGSFISYTVFRSVINTAQDGGGAAGQGKGSAMPVFRIIFGVSLLMPMYQGYSMAQVSVMWSVVQGVGLADTMWDRTVDYIADTGGGLLAPPFDDSYGEMKDLAINDRAGNWDLVQPDNNASMNDLMASALCLSVVEQSANALIESVANNAVNSVNYSATTSIGAQVRVGSACGVAGKSNIVCFGVTSAPRLCGAYTWDLTDNSRSGSVVSSVGGIINNSALNYMQIMTDNYNQIINFLNNYSGNDNSINFSKLTIARQALDDDENLTFICRIPQANSNQRLSSCSPGVSITSSASQYYQAIIPARLVLPSESAGDDPDTVNQSAELSASIDDWVKNSKASGWLMAGQSYSIFAKTENTAKSTLDELSKYQFKLYKEVDGSKTLTNFMDYLVKNTNSFDNCIGESTLADNIFFDNLGDVIASQNGTSQYGGRITITPNQKEYVTACILSKSLNDYGKFANLSFNAIEAATLTARLNESSDNSHDFNPQLDYITAAALQVLFNNNLITGDVFLDSSKIWSTVRLDVPQDNIQVMLVNIFSNLLGFEPFSAASLDKTFSDGSLNIKNERFLTNDRYNQSCLNVRQQCLEGVTTLKDLLPDNRSILFSILFPNANFDSEISFDLGANHQGCFNRAVEQGCIKEGQGILGAMYSVQNNKRVDQLLLLSNLGISMLNNAVLYWTKTTSGVYEVSKAIANNYMAAMTVTATAGSLASAATKAGIAWGGIGSVAAGIGGAAEFIAKMALQILQFNYKFVMASLIIYLPFGATLAAMFFGLGVTLGLYLPLIPFLTFLFGAIGWLIAVIEAMVAAPLVALGVTHPSGHDLLGKAEQAVILLLGIFVRPAAMLIGFILAIILLYVAMEMLNTGFLSVIVSYLDKSFNDTGSQSTIALVGFCGILIIYTYVALAVVNQAFSLIYQVPEKLLRWIGGAPEANTTGQIMQEIKGGAKDSAGQAGQGASQTASQAPQVSPGMQQQPSSWKPEKEEAGGHEVQGDN